ncbi:hypothetical protein BCR33DRAFT_717187 [Rhizoclosmatium globosum]|uniref:Uncharacterized protein n=1 Tax=Rhizoclosmatium globosum TaxID=329046 RepID=A0A1Y2CCP8_9FUNG|nr:hypothetical protein BCR33DRAFT_717187 [Rhizoclosmatium globosum]|eukprot:ORY44095.1 hypothetical protein BCR33DRAFT_717187 [Rhizoclosmatium globosum]
MDLTSLTPDQSERVQESNHYFLICESVLSALAAILTAALVFFIVCFEIPARGHRLDISTVASPQNLLLVSLFSVLSMYTGCQAASYIPDLSPKSASVLSKVFVTGPILAEALFLYYSWIRSTVVVQLLISANAFRRFQILVRLSPFIFLLPISIQFLPLGSWLNFLLLCSMGLCAILSVTMDLFFSYCFMKLEVQNRNNNLSVPAFYFAISRYGLVVSFCGCLTILVYIASQLVYLKYEASIPPESIEYWIMNCSLAVVRDACLFSIPCVLFFMKMVLIKPSLLTGQSSAKSKLSEFLSENPAASTVAKRKMSESIQGQPLTLREGEVTAH